MLRWIFDFHLTNHIAKTWSSIIWKTKMLRSLINSIFSRLFSSEIEFYKTWNLRKLKLNYMFCFWNYDCLDPYIFYRQQCLFREDNGKLITESDKFTSVREIEGDYMIEVSYLNHALQNNPLLHFSYHHFCHVSCFFFRRPQLAPKLSSAEVNECNLNRNLIKCFHKALHVWLCCLSF